jgi:hypothetical protein
MTGKVALERLEEYHGDASTITDDDDNSMNYTHLEENSTASSDYSMIQISASLSLCVGLWQVLKELPGADAPSFLISSYHT